METMYLGLLLFIDVLVLTHSVDVREAGYSGGYRIVLFIVLFIVRVR